MKKSYLGISLVTLLLLGSQTFTLAQDRGVIVLPGTQKASLPQRTLAVIVGISKYPNLKPLDYADKDAYLFRSFLNSGAGGHVPDSNIKILTESEATSANFWLQGMRWLSDKKPQPGDRVYIYLAGHGDAINSAEYFFLTYDCEPGNDKNNYLLTGNIQLFNLKSRIAQMTASGVEVFLIMDACRTGDVPGGERGLSDFSQSVVEKRAGEILLLSAGTNQVAYEDLSFGGGHGLFTYHLIKGLGGEADEDGNGIVDFDELQNYLRTEVRKISLNKYKKSQIPEFCCSQNREVIVAKKDKAFTRFVSERNDVSDMFSLFAKMDYKERTVQENEELMGLDGYSDFKFALNAYDFAGKNSAEYFLDIILASDAEELLKTKIQNMYAVELLNFAQAKINLYVSGKEDEFKKYGAILDNLENRSFAQYKLGKIATTTYLTTAYYLKKALEILNNDSELNELYKYKLQFLELYASKDNLRKTDSDMWMKTMKEITTKHPTAYMYNLAGLFANNLELYEDATDYYNKAIQTAPSWFYPYNNIGVLYHSNLNQVDSARRWYQKALELNPNGYMSLMNLGLLEEEHGNYTAAEPLYLKALQIDTFNAVAYHYLTGISEKLGRKEEQLYYANKALSLDASNFLYAFELGNAHFQNANFQNAVSVFLKSHQINPNYYPTHKLLAASYHKLRNKKEAKKWEDSAANLFPKPESSTKPLSKSMDMDLWREKAPKLPMTASSAPGSKKADAPEFINYTGREIIISNISTITCADEQLGKIVVRVFINPKGVVLSATAGINTEDHKTTITSLCLLDWAKSNAQLLQFAETEEDKTQAGIVVFEVRSK
jgi:Flp pilus assembly protein TadD